MKKLLLVAMAAVMLFGMAACAAQPASGDLLMSDQPRDTSPAASDADLATLVEGNSDFAFDLYSLLSSQDGNLFYSPYSISQALAMTWAGARGQTEQSIAEALDFMLGQQSLHPAFNRLDLLLTSRGEGASGKGDEGFRLHVVNALWGQEGYDFLPEFLDVLAKNYGAGLRLLDFSKEPEQSRVTINDWVSEQTEGRIKDLIPQGVIDELTRLVLTNAIYFNAAWEHQFKEGSTSDGQFHLLDGGTVTVPMMRQTEPFGYAEGDGYQAVELPYEGGELSMVIFLPDQGKFGDFEAALDGQRAADIIGDISYKQVALTLPKFEFESSFGLKKALSDLGMGVAFTDGADFSGMDGQKNLLIQDVVHKAFVSVDENGTEAAAATAVIVGLTAAPAQPVSVEIDRPFIFLIRDTGTGAILFVGRVVNPAP